MEKSRVKNGNIDAFRRLVEAFEGVYVRFPTMKSFVYGAASTRAFF